MCTVHSIHMLMQKCLLPVKAYMFTDTNEVKAPLTRFPLRMLKGSEVMRCWDIFITAFCLILYQTASMLFFQKSVSRNISERVARLPVTTNRSAKTSFDPWIFSVSRNLTTNVMTNSLKINTYHDFYRAPQK